MSSSWGILIGNPADMIRLLAMFSIGGSFYICKEYISYSRRGAALATTCLSIGLSLPGFAHQSVALSGGYLLFWIFSMQVVRGAVGRGVYRRTGGALWTWRSSPVSRWPLAFAASGAGSPVWLAGPSSSATGNGSRLRSAHQRFSSPRVFNSWWWSAHNGTANAFGFGEEGALRQHAAVQRLGDGALVRFWQLRDKTKSISRSSGSTR